MTAYDLIMEALRQTQFPMESSEEPRGRSGHAPGAIQPRHAKLTTTIGPAMYKILEMTDAQISDMCRQIKKENSQTEVNRLTRDIYKKALSAERDIVKESEEKKGQEICRCLTEIRKNL